MQIPKLLIGTLQAKGDLPETGRKRLVPVDALRGLMIILMALDHANYFIAQRHPVGEHWGGIFPSYKSTLAFLTRFVTHLSAPGFFFLMGVGVILFTSNRIADGWTLARVRRHFLIRGLILVAFQFLLINPIWRISPIPFPRWYQGVLAALGGTLLLSILLLNMNSRIVLGGTVLMSFVVELSHPEPSRWGMLASSPWGLALSYSGGSSSYWVNYPVIPWLEFVTIGMVFGHWFKDQPALAYKRALHLGAFFLIAFIPLRAFDGFGNIRPLAGNSWIDFLNVVKYPPSWSFTFITMGLNLLLLAMLNWSLPRARGISETLAIYGRVPFFLYIAHLLLFAVMGRLLTPAGSSFLAMYLLWLVGLVSLYPLAVIYGHLKWKPTLRPILKYL